MTLLRCFAFVLLLACASCAMKDGPSPSSMVRMAEQAEGRGEPGAALDLYKRALQLDPGYSAAHRGLALLLDTMGDRTGAAPHFVAAAKAYEDDPAVQRGYGRVLLTQDKHDEARKAFAMALKVDGKDVKALNGLGVALDHLGDHVAAQKRYNEALELEPGNLSTLNNLAYSLILSGDYGAAIQKLEPEQSNPKATSALRQNLALAYGMAGMDLDAERMAKRDLPPPKVKENLAYYKRERAQRAAETAPYVELGSYATEDMAAAQSAKLEPYRAGTDLKIAIQPELNTAGGVPRFALRMTGFADRNAAQALCGKVAGQGLSCTTHGL